MWIHRIRMEVISVSQTPAYAPRPWETLVFIQKNLTDGETLFQTASQIHGTLVH